jgi:deferrochelatase/peroxidase EfeB
MIEIEDVQRGVLNLPFARWSQTNWTGKDVFLQAKGMTSAERRRAFKLLIERLLNQTDDSLITIALSARGLLQFGVNPGVVALLPEEFVEGSHTRTHLLNDPPPTEWQHSLGESKWDILIMHMAPKREHYFKEQLLAILSIDRKDWVVDSVDTYGERDPKPFGIPDGISNPTLRGSGQEVKPGNGVPDKRSKNGWRELAAGEVLFGYPNEEGEFPGATAAREILANGSFLVWRKIQHNDDSFEKLTAKVEGAEATIFGRDKKGRAPGHDPKKQQNDFTYEETSLEVPANAHIRRANPRLGNHFDREPFRTLTNSHRILRRGVQYDGGTIFRCYQTNIENQFEFIQREWLNGGERFHQGKLRDPIAGNRPRNQSGDPTDPNTTISRYDPSPKGSSPKKEVCYKGEVTTVLGSFYGFVPGYRVLRGLADGRWES